MKRNKKNIFTKKKNRTGLTHKLENKMHRIFLSLSLFVLFVSFSHMKRFNAFSFTIKMLYVFFLRSNFDHRNFDEEFFSNWFELVSFYCELMFCCCFCYCTGIPCGDSLNLYKHMSSCDMQFSRQLDLPLKFNVFVSSSFREKEQNNPNVYRPFKLSVWLLHVSVHTRLSSGYLYECIVEFSFAFPIHNGKIHLISLRSRN